MDGLGRSRGRRNGGSSESANKFRIRLVVEDTFQTGLGKLFGQGRRGTRVRW